MELPTPEKASLVTYHREGAIGFITLNRPEKRNAMNLALWNALGETVAAAEQDKDLRAAIVRGEGKSFCAGLDLGPENELIPVMSSPASAAQKLEFYRAVRHVQEIYNRLERLIVPTIAVIHGHCLGAGLELALCCDIRLTCAGTVFSLPEAQLAIITDVGGLQRLPKVVGPGYAREIAFRGHRFSPEWAKEIGLVNHLYPEKETLDAAAKTMAEEIAANPPLAVQGTKEVLLYNDEVGLNEALEYTASRSSMIIPSEDLIEAVQAFAQKRKGQYKGR
ncbi:MAG: enoyl-CoA hydratase/isomerase family protein [Desulfomonile sp.]|nr:enoyl-CoA hydratase/isomerase family protein [Desulfomonile sp.]